MQIASIGLPMLKNRNTFTMNAGEAKSYSNTDVKKEALKPKKITDYANAVNANYKTLRNITININKMETAPFCTWLSTRYSDTSHHPYSIQLNGNIDWNTSKNVYGLRPVIIK